MDHLNSIIETVLTEMKESLMPSTFLVRKNYLLQMKSLGEELGYSYPCQELYDVFTARASTPDLRF